MVLVQKELQNAYIGEYVPPIPYLCFTAEEANSTVQLTKTGSPTEVALETSTNGTTWTDYTIGNTITLTNVGDKVYMRNKSETPTGFSTQTNAYYKFVMSGSINASGDVCYLLCKNSTIEIPTRGFTSLFSYCTSLIIAPRISATKIGSYGCVSMFQGCSNLIGLPKIVATDIGSYGCNTMFSSCSSIKLASTQDSDYTQPYRIPSEGTGTAGSNAFYYMFTYTGGTFKGTPTIDTTYYLHKDNVPVD